MNILKSKLDKIKTKTNKQTYLEMQKKQHDIEIK